VRVPQQANNPNQEEAYQLADFKVSTAAKLTKLKAGSFKLEIRYSFAIIPQDIFPSKMAH
jgi:hypothetical protein